MGVERRFYCPWCGNRITNDTRKYVQATGRPCFDADCEGQPDET